MKQLLAVTTLVFLAAVAHAGGIEPAEFQTPAQEARYKDLIAELRCLVCQNQNIQDSNAELAQDLRRKTRELIQQDMSDDEIRDYMVQRYGDFVLYSPPIRTRTILLWAGPFIILAIGLAVMIITVRRRRRQDESVDLASAEIREASSLLDTKDKVDRS